MRDDHEIRSVNTPERELLRAVKLVADAQARQLSPLLEVMKSLPPPLTWAQWERASR
jgi:hypothetical protein